MGGIEIFPLLLVFWFILSGKLTLEIAIFGVLVTCAVYAFACKSLEWSFSRELLLYRLAPRAILYILVLFVEIVKANAAVLPYIFGLRAPDGVTVEFDSPLSGKTANAVLANSITLTPGTITVSVKDGHFTVHCLAPGFDTGLETSIFVRQLEKMEKTANGLRAKEKQRKGGRRS